MYIYSYEKWMNMAEAHEVGREMHRVPYATYVTHEVSPLCLSSIRKTGAGWKFCL